VDNCDGNNPKAGKQSVHARIEKSTNGSRNIKAIITRTLRSRLICRPHISPNDRRKMSSSDIASRMLINAHRDNCARHLALEMTDRFR